MSKDLVDIQEVIEKLSSLRQEILGKYSLEEIEALRDSLLDFDYPKMEYALFFSEDFPTMEILEKKGLPTDYERGNLYFQSLLLQLIIAVFQSANDFFPGLSGYEMLRIVGRRVRYQAQMTWPFSDLVEEPRRRKKNNDEEEQ